MESYFFVSGFIGSTPFEHCFSVKRNPGAPPFICRDEVVDSVKSSTSLTGRVVIMNIKELTKNEYMVWTASYDQDNKQLIINNDA